MSTTPMPDPQRPQTAVEYPCMRCGAEVGPGEPDGGLDERLCLRCWQEDGSDVSQTTAMRSAEQIAQEMTEELRRRFGHDMRHPAGRAWLASCIMEARHEMALELGLSDAPRPGSTDPWRLNRDG